MFWVVQSNMFSEPAFEDLMIQLERQQVQYAMTKVIPFSHEMEPKVEPPPGPVYVCGSLSMAHVADREGWKPGYFHVPDYNFVCSLLGEEHMLNYPNTQVTVRDLANLTTWYPNEAQRFFVRPAKDTKSFAGGVMQRHKLLRWVKKVVALEGDSSFTTLTGDDQIILAPVKEIWAEYRFFVIDGAVVTGSLYKQANKVLYSNMMDDDITAFVQRIVDGAIGMPRAYALDVAVTPDGLRVIETNSINSSGFYACDMGKYVHAINSMEFGE